MKTLILSVIGAAVFAAPALAADPAAGEGDFKRCKACHAITAEDGTDIVKGGKTGPNLFGVIGRPVGAVEDFRYGDGLVAANEAGLVWDEENLAEYITDPGAWLKSVLDDPGAKSKMTYKHKKGAEDMAAYLASLGS
ncbi:c-type cytochrome [Maritimibacter dapengensis]|uniref:Cytochrome C n=1 Tax=Maritimibacter dapengensis TaxID=2836868 RepID=A0ABS6T1Q5_9RHOB|nr:cytochrome C [Maritimibacter dapengensis]MBV7378915.1 cytochrome C [Maritimibacter dapengensis]